MNQHGEVLAVNLSPKRGTKSPKESICLQPGGVKGDCHFGSGNREVSILDQKHADDFARISKSSGTFAFGDFAENIRSRKLPEDIRIYDRLKIGNSIIMVTENGKPFHEKLEFPGHYVSPQKAVFCKVIEPGEVKAGDAIIHVPKVFHIKIIILSDRAASGTYRDESGPLIRDFMQNFCDNENLRNEISVKVIADDADLLKRQILSAEANDFIMTSGGTGISGRDITIETIRPLLDKEVPGITEMIRWKYGLENPAALLSRSLAGLKGRSLIFCMPGSPKAVKEYMQEYLKVASHALKMVNGFGH